MKKFKIILAVDIAGYKTLTLIRETLPLLDGVKIGLAPVLQHGIYWLRAIRNIVSPKLILFDLKISDIGIQKDGKWEGTNSKIVKTLCYTGITHLTAHAFPGSTSLQETVETAHKFNIKVLTLPMMTPPTAEPFFADKMRAIFLIGESLGVDGYIGPGNKLRTLQYYRNLTDKEIWSPGFGRQNSPFKSVTEQIREWYDIVGSNSAIILGSYIYNSQNPIQRLEEIHKLREQLRG